MAGTSGALERDGREGATNVEAPARSWQWWRRMQCMRVTVHEIWTQNCTTMVQSPKIQNHTNRNEIKSSQNSYFLGVFGHFKFF
eukprot:4914642-Amphidinium_carterae.1